MTDPSQMTRLLNRASAGDEAAANEVYPLIYGELRKLASGVRRRVRVGETLQVTALVNEAYLRVAERDLGDWQARSHFFFAAARAMRDILVDNERKRSASKRGGGVEHEDSDEVEIAGAVPSDMVLSLNAAIDRLETADPEGHKVAMLRYFAGLSVPEVAEVMNISVSTIERKWRFLRVWFADALADGE